MTARILKGDSAQNYLEAKALLDTLGIDPDAEHHWNELGQALDAGARMSHWNRLEAHSINRATDEAAAIAEDVEFLLQQGRSPESIVAGLDTTLTAMEKRLRRAFRPDLARPFERARRARRAS